MTTVIASLTLEERLDQLSAQVTEIAGDLRRQREAHEQWQELAQALVPVSRGAFDLASRELEDLSDDVTVEDAVRFARTMARTLPQLETLLAQVPSMTELGKDVSTLSGPGIAKVSNVLAEAERKGYFTVARGSATVADRVVAVYADADFEALGDNLALLLGVVSKVADPALIGLLDRAVDTLQESASTHLDPPSAFGLLKQLREPQTRRGVARALELLQALGAEPTTASDPDHRKE